MTEKEKMLAGKIYDPSDKELVGLRTKAHRLSKEYNELLETDERRAKIIKELGIIGDAVYFQGPIQFDYGCFTSIGKNFYANFNFTCLDCCPVTIGDNVFMILTFSTCVYLNPTILLNLWYLTSLYFNTSQNKINAKFGLKSTFLHILKLH